MRSVSVVVVLVVLDVVAALVAEPIYYDQVSCLPKTYHLTHYETKLQEVPVYSTVYKPRVVPTTVYRTRQTTRYITKYETKEVSRYVTHTAYKTLAEVVSQVQTKFSTRYRSRYITRTATSYTTKTEYKTVTGHPHTKTLYSTRYTPQYTTKRDHLTHYKTQVIPEYHTVTVTQPMYKVVCPRDGYGHHTRRW